MVNWEDYLMALGVAAGTIASLEQNNPAYFIILTGLAAFTKALKDIRDAKKKLI